MENQSAMVGLRVLDSGSVTVTSCGDDGSEHQKSNGVKEESENLGNDLLHDLDSYLEDINDRLMISRMVSDSVIKGMVNAVEQEAYEKIESKELEVANLKELLQNHQVGIDEIEFSGFQVPYHEPISTQHGMSHNIFFDAFVEDNKMGETLGSLRDLARNEIKKLREDINSLRGCSSIRRICSGSELVGLGGIPQEKAFESCVGVNKTTDTLSTIVDDMFQLATASFCEWRQEQKFRGELEARVIQSCVRSFQEEFEEKMWAQHTLFSDTQNVNWLEKMKEISSLRQELDTVLKSLSSAETGHLHSHGSQDMDHFHLSSSHVSSSGKLDEAKNGKPENWGAAQLNHMSKEELVNYFNTFIWNMKRNHESKVHEMTEEYYILKREYLRERGSSLPPRKDNKEFEMLKKKIPEVILQLDDILMQNEILPTFSTNVETIGILKERLDNLLSKNRHLRESLADKKNELKYLSSQVSDAAEKMLKHSLNEANLLKLIEDLKSSVEDAHIGAFVVQEVYKCSLRDVTAEIQRDTGDLTVESKSFVAEASSKCEIEDSDMESWIMKGLLELVFREVIKGAESQLRKFDTRYVQENEIRVDLERKALEKEKELKMLVKEKERLKGEVHLLTSSIEDEKKNSQEISVEFTKEREQFELVYQELHDLRDQVSGQQTVISESSKESDLVKGKLVEALNQIEFYRVEISKLNQNLELSMKQLKEADEERSILRIVIQERQNDLLLVQAKEKEQSKQMERVIAIVHGLSKALADTECKVAENMDKHNLRLGYITSQLSCLIPKATIQRKSGLLYKQRFERRCSDLQMAEAEVDLLGDEVDALLSLLEKIYIGLDHYSPVLQHYPGIMDTLKLVKRELSGEHTKLEQLST